MAEVQFEEDLDKVTGGELRKRYEDTLKTLRERDSEVALLRADKVIRDNGYTLADPQALVGVEASELEEKARELHEAKWSDQTSLIRRHFESQGMSGEVLEDAVRKFVDGGETTAGTTYTGFAPVIPEGVPVGTVQADVHGYDALLLGVQQAEKKARR